jgi:threonine aldolase
MVMPLTEARRICEYAHTKGIQIHLDGARLWEAVVANDWSLEQFCSLFDTVSLCFSKGLGAPAGAIVVANKAIIRQARWVRQSIGGSIRQPGLLAEAAYTVVQDTFEGNQLARTHDIATRISRHWISCGGRLVYPTQTNMVWLDFTGLPFGLDDLINKAKEKGLAIHRNRIVIHYREHSLFHQEGLN